MTKERKFKRLFFDIETSYNIVSSWRVGRDIHITHDNIIKERAIICICWKWEGKNKVHSLQWKKGDDKPMLVKFLKVLDSADEIVGQNSDKFDIKWIRTRCFIHGISMMPAYQSVDTLKLARGGFNFNSNRLDYLGKISGHDGKMDTGGLKLWQDIIMDNCSTAMNKMVKYCKRDVVLLEKVFIKMKPYVKSKTHVGMTIGKDFGSCPECGEYSMVGRGVAITAGGTKKQRLQCMGCGKYTTAPLAKLEAVAKKRDKSIKKK